MRQQGQLGLDVGGHYDRRRQGSISEQTDVRKRQLDDKAFTIFFCLTSKYVCCSSSRQSDIDLHQRSKGKFCEFHCRQTDCLDKDAIRMGLRDLGSA